MGVGGSRSEGGGAAGAARASNPGAFDAYNREARGILHPDFWQGLRFEYNKQASPVFVLAHGLYLGDPQQEPTYSFTAQYLTRALRAVGRVDTSGVVNTRWMFNVTPRTEGRISSQMVGGQTAWQGEVEHQGRDFTAQVSVTHAPTVRMSYLQTISPRVVLGSALSFELHPGLVTLQLAARLLQRNGVWAASTTGVWVPKGHPLNGGVAPVNEVSLSYVHRFAGEKVKGAAQVSYDGVRGATSTLLGVQYELRGAAMTLYATSAGVIGTVLDQRVDIGSMIFSGNIDYVQDQYSFGMGFQL